MIANRMALSIVMNLLAPIMPAIAENIVVLVRSKSCSKKNYALASETDDG